MTLRSVEVVKGAGLTSLAITYRGSGDGPPAPASTLGQREWMDLADAVAYARRRGASSVYVVAWSMGAGFALELLRHDPAAINRLALIAPATSWQGIIRRGVSRAGLPALISPVVTGLLSSRAVSPVVGLPEPLNFERLDWRRAGTSLPTTVVIHSTGDDEIAFGETKDFAVANPNVTLVETDAAPHGFEANVDPSLFRSALETWLGGH